MRTLILGDIHGRNCWKEIIKNENPDMTIFLGDYVTSREGISEEDQIENLKGILEYKESNPDSVILLRGNHDMEALKYYWAQCYPYFESNWLYDNKERFLNATQWIYEIGDIVFSHAGVSEIWFSNVSKYCKTHNISLHTLSDINNIEPCELFGFIPENSFDSYGDSKTQPLTWIRPYTLRECGVENKTFVVGHTRFNNDIIHMFPDVETKSEIICCDALPYHYLIYDDSLEAKFENKVFQIKHTNIR